MVGVKHDSGCASLRYHIDYPQNEEEDDLTEDQLKPLLAAKERKRRSRLVGPEILGAEFKASYENGVSYLGKVIEYDGSRRGSRHQIRWSSEDVSWHLITVSVSAGASTEVVVTLDKKYRLQFVAKVKAFWTKHGGASKVPSLRFNKNLVGRVVSKCFGEYGEFTGRVIGVKEGKADAWYHVEYSDGDCEDFVEDTLLPLLKFDSAHRGNGNGCGSGSGKAKGKRPTPTSHNRMSLPAAVTAVKGKGPPRSGSGSKHAKHTEHAKHAYQAHAQAQARARLVAHTHSWRPCDEEDEGIDLDSSIDSTTSDSGASSLEEMDALEQLERSASHQPFRA